MNLVVIIVAALSSSLALIAYRLRQNRTLPGDVAFRTSRLLQVGASPRVADLLARGDRICAIKAYREEHQVGSKHRAGCQVLDLAKTSALQGELTMQCSSCGKTLLPSTTVCPMCKTPVPNRGSAQADDEYTEYADVLHQPIPFVETQKAFFDVQPSSPAQETTLSEHRDRQLVPPHHFQSEKRAMRYNSTELVVAIALLLLGLTFLGGALFSSEGFGGHLDKVIIGVLGLITSAIAFGGVAKAHLARSKNERKAQDR